METRPQLALHRNQGRRLGALASDLAIVILIAFVLITAACRAKAPEPPAPTVKEPAVASPIMRIMDQLNLTAEQQSAVQPIVKSDQERHRAVFAKYPAGNEEGKKAMGSELRAIDQETATQLAAILTAEQMSRFTALRDELIKNRMATAKQPLEPLLVRVFKRLDLNQEQKDAVQPIIKSDMEQHRAFKEKQGGAGGNDTQRNELEAIDQETEKRLAVVLTAEQMTRYRELRDELRREMPPPGGSPGGPEGR